MKAYDKYKDSGIDWLGSIPAHWEVRKLKYICAINKNSLDENIDPTFKFRYVDIGSVSYENGIEYTEEYIFKNSPSRARRIAKEGDIIISSVRTYLKAIDFIDKEKSKYIYSTGFAVLEPLLFINPLFLSYCAKNDSFTEQVSFNSKGMSYPAINSTDLGNLFLSLPPIAEQSAIATYLDEATAKIDKSIGLYEAEIDKFTEYKSSLINAVVTGKVKVG